MLTGSYSLGSSTTRRPLQWSFQLIAVVSASGSGVVETTQWSKALEVTDSCSKQLCVKDLFALTYSSGFVQLTFTLKPKLSSLA